MQLTKFTDYSIRVLTYVAVTNPEQLSQISQVCEAYNISKNHVMKVVQELGQLGYLETIRGKNGGFRLACPPSEICVGTLVRQTEKNLNAFDCYSPPCAIVKSCMIKGVFKEATDAYLEVLDSYTLEDLLKPKRSLRKLLDI